MLRSHIARAHSQQWHARECFITKSFVGGSADRKECEAATFIFTLPPQYHWRGDGDEIGPNEITIATVHVYHLTANARSDSEVLAEFAEILSTLPADVLYVNFGEMDMKALRSNIHPCFLAAAAPTVFWGCVKAVSFNVAFLLNFDRGFAKHLRIRKHGLPRMPALEEQAFLRCLHITAKAESATQVQPHEADVCCISNGGEAHGQKRRKEESDDNNVGFTPKKLRSGDASSGKFTIAVPPKPQRLVPPPPPPPPPPPRLPPAVSGYPLHQPAPFQLPSPFQQACWRSPVPIGRLWDGQHGLYTWYAR